MDKQSPRISVVMSVYNGEKYLHEAVDSILNQTFTDFEFIIIDDASIDGTWEILSSYCDPRIRLVHNQENIGLTRSLNKGLALAQGEYIARMDADDISLPKRFEKQIVYLDLHPDIWVVGGQIDFIDDKGSREQAHPYPIDEKFLRWNAIFNGPTVIHPAVMMRQEKLNQLGNYPEDCKLAQDAALWRKFYMVSDFPIANLGEKLVLYRQHTESLGRVARTEQVDTVTRYQTLFYQHILGDQCPAELVAILIFSSRVEYSSDLPGRVSNSY
jgi:glycosyltransferase involved in cell wall biosynthesis